MGWVRSIQYQSPQECAVSALDQIQGRPDYTGRQVDNVQSAAETEGGKKGMEERRKREKTGRIRGRETGGRGRSRGGGERIEEERRCLASRVQSPSE